MNEASPIRLLWVDDHAVVRRVEQAASLFEGGQNQLAAYSTFLLPKWGTYLSYQNSASAAGQKLSRSPWNIN